MLYRFYDNGIRVTIGAASREAADAKLRLVRATYASDFKCGNRNVPRPGKGIVIANKSVRPLNAYDTGFALGKAGATSIPVSVQNRYDEMARRIPKITAVCNSAIRAGLVAGSR